MKKITAPAMVLTGLLAYSNFVSAQTLSAHEHGSASLEMAIDNDVIAIRFESPAANIVGFEYTPESEAQTLLVAQAKKTLSDFDAVFKLEGDAACQVRHASANWSSENEEHESIHAEFLMEFELQCKKTANLNAVHVRLFELFPSIEKITAQTVSANGQSKQTLSAKQPTIELKKK